MMSTGGPTFEEIGRMNLDHFLDKDVDLSQYFSNQELEAMGNQQQTRFRNIAQNYEIMQYMGLPAIKPDFMKGKLHREKKVKPKEHQSFDVGEDKNNSDSDSDETWTPDLERKKRMKEKLYPSLLTQKKRKSTNSGRKEQKPKTARKVNDDTDEKRVYQLRERQAANCMNLEAPDDDHFLYCEECNKEYDMDCPIHGPLDYIRDTEVCTDYDSDRALHSLPPGLIVKESSIVGAGLGVFTQTEIPSRTMFGPYGGVKIHDEQIAHDSGYCWQIYQDGKPSHFVDAKDKAYSNWMRYVNCAPSESEQNLEAFQYKGDIYYRSYKAIQSGTELLCWYGNEYGRELGLVRDKNMLLWPKMVLGKECYPCVFCKMVFTKAVYNVRHLLRVHQKDKLVQSDIQVLDEWLRKNDWEEYTKRQRQKNHVEENNCVLSHLETNREDGSLCLKNISMLMQDKHECKLNGLGKKRSKYQEVSCSKSITNKMSNNMRIQTKEKCFKCDVCDYASYHRGHLKTHKRIHTGEKCFKCDVCDYACNQSSALKTHKRIHTGEKCFKCDVCDYACNQSGNLKTHKRIHTGEKCFKCNVCDYACNRSGTLKRHKRIHTGEKCFKCDVCDYACNRSGTLKRHKRIHTGEKCFKCDVCDYACNQSGNLKTHKRKHTEEKC